MVRAALGLFVALPARILAHLGLIRGRRTQRRPDDRPPPAAGAGCPAPLLPPPTGRSGAATLEIPKTTDNDDKP